MKHSPIQLRDGLLRDAEQHQRGARDILDSAQREIDLAPESPINQKFGFLDGFDRANVAPVRAHYGHTRLDVSRIRTHDHDLLGHAAWQRTQNGQEQAVYPSPVTGHAPASTTRDKIHLCQPGHRKCNPKQYSFFYLSLPGPLIAP